jgi:hypothetical protein
MIIGFEVLLLLHHAQELGSRMYCTLCHFSSV